MRFTKTKLMLKIASRFELFQKIRPNSIYSTMSLSVNTNKVTF